MRSMCAIEISQSDNTLIELTLKASTRISLGCLHPAQHVHPSPTWRPDQNSEHLTIFVEWGKKSFLGLLSVEQKAVEFKNAENGERGSRL